MVQSFVVMYGSLGCKARMSSTFPVINNAPSTRRDQELNSAVPGQSFFFLGAVLTFQISSLFVRIRQLFATATHIVRKNMKNSRDVLYQSTGVARIQRPGCV